MENPKYSLKFETFSSAHRVTNSSFFMHKRPGIYPEWLLAASNWRTCLPSFAFQRSAVPPIHQPCFCGPKRPLLQP